MGGGGSGVGGGGGSSGGDGGDSSNGGLGSGANGLMGALGGLHGGSGESSGTGSAISSGNSFSNAVDAMGLRGATSAGGWNSGRFDGGLMSARPDRNQAVNDVKSEITSRANSGEITGMQALSLSQAADLGQLSALRAAGLTDAAAHLSRSYSNQDQGLMSMVKGMFSGEEPANVMTPRAEVIGALKNNTIAANADKTGYAITPQGYLAALALPAKLAGSLALGAVTSGLGFTGIPGIAANAIGGIGLDAALSRATDGYDKSVHGERVGPSATDPGPYGTLANVAKYGGIGAGALGNSDAAGLLGVGSLMSRNYGGMQGAMRVGSALDAGNNTYGSMTNGVTSNGENDSLPADVISPSYGVLGSGDARSALIDPLSWYNDIRLRRG